MLLNTRTGDIERSGVTAESQFRIKTTAKAFEILSTGLYSNPVLAIIRELSSNAYDAHVAANKGDVPFEIHLPNTLEPFFCVRDFGTGLSDEDVFNLYTTYFDSTKTDSNDFIGALGLGSKSPFSYTSAFEVISRFNGTRRIYSIFINEDGIPTVARLGEFATDENNGLEVKLSVKGGDFHKFRAETSTALMHFPIKPRVIGDSAFQWTSLPEAHLQGNNWKIARLTDYNSSSSFNITIVHGHIPYRVDWKLASEKLVEAERTALSSFIGRNMRLYIYFDIGDVEVAASREEVRYDERTKANIAARLRKVVDEFIVQLEAATIATVDGREPWDSFVALDTYALKTFSNKNFIINAPWPMAPNGKRCPADAGQIVSQYINDKGTFTPSVPRAHKIVSYRVRSSRRRRYNSNLTLRREVIVRDPLKDIVPTSTNTRTIRADHKTLFFYNDVGQRALERITAKIVSISNGGNEIDTVYVVTPIRRQNIDKRYSAEREYVGDIENLAHCGIIKANEVENCTTKALKMLETPIDYNKDLDDLWKSVGNPTVFIVSRDTAYIEGEKRSVTRKLYQIDHVSRGRYKNKVVWNKHDVDIEQQTGLYFRIKNGHHIVDAKDRQVLWSPDNYQSFLETMVEVINAHYDTSYQYRDVYGVPHTLIKSVQEHSNWDNIFVLFDATLDKFVDYWKFKQDLLQVKDPWSFSDMIDDAKFRTHVRSLVDTSTFKKVFEPLIATSDKYSDVKGFNINTIGRIANLKEHQTTSCSMTEYQSALIARYPMLSFVSSYSKMGNELDNIFNYIRLVDTTT